MEDSLHGQRRMHKKLLAYIKPSRSMLALTIVLGMLGALATMAQIALLSEIVNAVFLWHRDLAQVLVPLALLMAALLLRASLIWAREATAQRAAIRLKSSLQERVFAHLPKIVFIGAYIHVYVSLYSHFSL